MPSRSKLNDRQRRFVAEYLVDLNASQAAIRAGYAAANANVVGSRLLAHVSIRSEIDAALAKRAKRVEVKQDDVLRELVRIGLSDARQAFDENGRMRPVHELPDDIAHAVSSVEVEELFEGTGRERECVGQLRKVKLWDKNRALENLAKHLGLLSGEDDGDTAKRDVVVNIYGAATVEADA